MKHCHNFYWGSNVPSLSRFSALQPENSFQAFAKAWELVLRGNKKINAHDKLLFWSKIQSRYENIFMQLCNVENLKKTDNFEKF